MTAKEWRDKNPNLDGNIRDYTDILHLVVLANLENLNAEMITIGISQSERIVKLNNTAKKQLELLTKLVPDIKTIGVIYNSSEANSLAQVQELKKEAEKKNIKVKEISVTTVNEINQNLTAALGEIDALYAPTDNTVASAYDLVGNICLSKNIPILCGEEAGVSKGGLCSSGIDYNKLGKEAGYKAAEILNGKSPSDIEITTLSDMTITINTDVVKKLNITVPDDINSKAAKVTGGVK